QEAVDTGVRVHQRQDESLEQDRLLPGPGCLAFEQSCRTLIRDGCELPFQDEAVRLVPMVQEIAAAELEPELLAQPRARDSEPVGVEIDLLQNESLGQDPG